jgi:hypothetical protein
LAVREAAITLLACAMVLVPAPVALASQQTAAVGAASGGAREGVEPRSENPEKPGKPSPTSSPDDPEESGGPDEPRDPDDPEEDPSRPSWPSLPSWSPGGGSSPGPDPTPTPEPTSGEPSGEPSGTAPGGDGGGERTPDGADGPDGPDDPDDPDDGASAEPPGTSRQSPQAWTEQISDRRAGTGAQYDDYVYDDGQGGPRYSESRATPATGGQLLPVLPLGAGLTFLGLGLASFALRLRR